MVQKKKQKRRVCGILFLLPKIAKERGQGRARGSHRRPGPHGSKKKGKRRVGGMLFFLFFFKKKRGEGQAGRGAATTHPALMVQQIIKKGEHVVGFLPFFLTNEGE